MVGVITHNMVTVVGTGKRVDIFDGCIMNKDVFGMSGDYFI
jgi:hypothetical protein